MKTSKEISKDWGITERMVTKLCKDGRIPGAIKEGKSWLIPDASMKPRDQRTSNENDKENIMPLPIGISDYVRAQSEYYYVDKTLLIKEFLDHRPLVSLFTRPRRFGKTINMDMLRVFFEISPEDTSVYFKTKEIWKCGEAYTKHQGKYPVIFLTFKDVKFDSWDKTIRKISGILQTEFSRHSELLDSTLLADYEKDIYHRILQGNASQVELASALEHLSRMLCKHHGTAPIIIIDEYDTPIQEGYAKHFYDDIITFMRNFFSGAFKDNPNLSYGFLTGILRIAQESIFSGLNNLVVNSVMDEAYDQFFGFTYSEVEQILQYYSVSNKVEELKSWYNGYRFGRREIYNPWSVINYVSKGCIPQAYWVNTGKNEILGNILRSAAANVSERLFSLLNGETILARINQNIVYPTLSADPSSVYSLLLVAGYLNAEDKKLLSDGAYLCEVKIPNREIAAIYKSEILSHLFQIGAITRTTADRVAESLYSGNIGHLQTAIAEYMDGSVSFYDTGTEGFYHGMMLGLIALMEGDYTIKSNRESGKGRFDICMIPRHREHPGIIMEFKWKKGLTESNLETAANEALAQINQKEYDTDMRHDHIDSIIKLGIAFSGKKVKILSEMQRL